VSAQASAFDKLRLTPFSNGAILQCVTLSLSKGDARTNAGETPAVHS
jgi:hypothetical protein